MELIYSLKFMELEKFVRVCLQSQFKPTPKWLSFFHCKKNLHVFSAFIYG